METIYVEFGSTVKKQDTRNKCDGTFSTCLNNYSSNSTTEAQHGQLNWRIIHQAKHSLPLSPVTAGCIIYTMFCSKSPSLLEL